MTSLGSFHATEKTTSGEHYAREIKHKVNVEVTDSSYFMVSRKLWQ